MFYAKMPLVSGGYTYCTQSAKITPSNVVEKLSKEADGGITYILENGYPKKNITGNENYDYYITQTAIWWYLDEVTGSSNLSESFKTDGQDEFSLRPYIVKLVNDAKANKGGSASSIVLNPTSTGLALSADGKYFETTIEPKFTNITGTYNAIASNSKVTITDSNNISKNTFNVNESFKIRITNGSYDPSTYTVTVTAKDIYSKAYEYVSDNSAIQSVVVLQPVEDEIKASLELAMQPTCENGGLTDGCEIAVIPDTGTNTSLYIVGIIVLVSGLGLVLYNAKLTK